MVDLVRAVNDAHPRYDLLGVLDDGRPDLALLSRLGLSLLGRVTVLATMPAGTRYLLGLGSGQLRRQVDEWATSQGREPLTLLHPTAIVGPDVQLEPGVVICAHASVTTNVRLGRHTHVNVAATVAHDCRVGAFVTLSPGARLSGAVRLGDGVTLGTGAVALPGICVGEDTIVGAGAVVTRDIPGHATAIGVPARVGQGAVERPGQSLVSRTFPR